MSEIQVTQLGQVVAGFESPEAAVLERVPNPQKGQTYLARFTAPEFTSLCPVTGQPDFATLVIDYAPADWLVESKSLKLFLASFRNHGAFHGGRPAGLAAHRRLLVSPRRHSHRCLLADRGPARRPLAARPGRGSVPRTGLTRIRASSGG